MSSNSHGAQLWAFTWTLFGCSRGHLSSFSQLSRDHQSVTWSRYISSSGDCKNKLHHPILVTQFGSVLSQTVSNRFCLPDNQIKWKEASRSNIISFSEKPVDSCTEVQYPIIRRWREVSRDPSWPVESLNHAVRRQSQKAWSSPFVTESTSDEWDIPRLYLEKVLHNYFISCHRKYSGQQHQHNQCEICADLNGFEMAF